MTLWVAPSGHRSAGAGSVLLAALDSAMSRDASTFAPGRLGANRDTPGLAAAVGLNKLLLKHKLTWADVVAPGSLLIKLCGRLGSDYQAEREAAYAHALRFVIRQRTTWSQLVRLPMELRVAPPPPKPVPPRVASWQLQSVSPPEEDWITSVKLLKARSAWRSEAERALLDQLQVDLADGMTIRPEHARRLRDMWWWAELNDPSSAEDVA